MATKKFSTQSIVNTLKDEGKYSSELLMQATLLSRLLAKLTDIEAKMKEDDYSPTIMETSCTGTQKLVINPLETLYLQYYDRVQRAIKALGMNMDSKERKSDHDTFEDFMTYLKEDDE